MSLKSFLRSKGISRHFMIQLRSKGMVLVNGQEQHFYKPLTLGDQVVIDPYLRDETNIEAQEMDLTVLFEDPDYLILSKPWNQASHPTGEHTGNTLANGAHHYLKARGIPSIHPVHRLDRTTSGVMVFAKHPIAQHALTLDKGKKEYRALVEGLVEAPEGSIDEPIAKIDAPSIRRIVTEKGKHALTDYQVLVKGPKRTLLRVILHTGRTHQIRVHLAHIGHPLVGDFLYGKEDAPRLFLHAYKFTFRHFRTNEIIEVVSSLPEVFLEHLAL